MKLWEYCGTLSKTTARYAVRVNMKLEKPFHAFFFSPLDITLEYSR